MDDLISRQAAKNKKVYSEERHEYVVPVAEIDWLPSAQPERKKGKWIRHDEIKNVYGGICIECSECGEKYVVQHILDEKYCRNCGAKMEVGENAD